MKRKTLNKIITTSLSVGLAITISWMIRDDSHLTQNTNAKNVAQSSSHNTAERDDSTTVVTAVSQKNTSQYLAQESTQNKASQNGSIATHNLLSQQSSSTAAVRHPSSTLHNIESASRSNKAEQHAAELADFQKSIEKISNLSQATDPKSYESQLRSGQPVLATATVHAQADTHTLTRSDFSKLPDAVQAKSEYANSANFGKDHAYTQYQGTLDAWQVQTLKVGDHFSLPKNSTDQADFRVTARSDGDSVIFISAEPLKTEGDASFRLAMTDGGVRFFGTLQTEKEVFDYISNDGQFLTVVEQRILD